MTLPLFALAWPFPAWAAGSGAAFLKIDTGARPAAMGGAYTALAEDVHALHYNPAGLSRLPKHELGLTHAEWLLGSKFDFIGFAQPTKLGAFGLGLTRLAAGGIENRAADRRSSGSFEASDTAYSVGFSRPLKGLDMPGALSLGANVKYLESRIGPDSASALALDLGSSCQFPGRHLSLALAVRNIGPGMRFLDQTDPLPLSVVLGGAYRLAGVQLSLDLRREVHAETTDIGLGTEYALLSRFALRAGYASRSAGLGTQGGGLSVLGGLAGGFGLRLGGYQADYAFAPFGVLGGAQRISLGARW